MTRIRRVGVVGCGLMGTGIAEVCARSGFETTVREVSDTLLDRGLERIRASLDRGVEKGALTGPEAEEALGRITGTVDLEALAPSDLVIEAIAENLREKRTTLETLDRAVQEAAIFASNTSSLAIIDLAMTTNRPERFVGLHFFNPVPRMRLVEIVTTIATDEATRASAVAFVEAIGKEPIECRDTSGFVVNRLLVPYLLDAIRALEGGGGTVEEVDRAMCLACGHPMGPFQLLDLVGLDTTLSVAEIMFEEYRERRFAPPPLLRRMVSGGRLGRKSGRGFYEYGS